MQWSDIAIVPQAIGLLDELTVWENVELPARILDQHPDVAAVLARLGLDGLAPRRVRAGAGRR